MARAFNKDIRKRKKLRKKRKKSMTIIPRNPNHLNK